MDERITRRRSAGPGASSNRPASSFPGGGPPGFIGLPAGLLPFNALRSRESILCSSSLRRNYNETDPGPSFMAWSIVMLVRKSPSPRLARA